MCLVVFQVIHCSADVSGCVSGYTVHSAQLMCLVVFQVRLHSAQLMCLVVFQVTQCSADVSGCVSGYTVLS